MIDPLLRLRFTILLALAASVVVFVAVAGTTGLTLDGEVLREVAAHIQAQINWPVRVRLVPREGRMALEIRYVPAAERFREESAVEFQNRIMEQAVIRYPGFLEEVVVRAVPPEELLPEGAAEASLVGRVPDLRRKLDRDGRIAYGDYHWPVTADGLRAWKYVLVHHSASERGSAESLERWHRRGRGWDALAYQFVIGNGNGSGDGQIEAGERWTAQMIGAHAGVNKLMKDPSEKNKYNEEAVGLCLVGNFFSGSPGGGSRPTEAQLESLRFLTLYLCLKFGLEADAVLGHGDVAQTECPGDLFPKAAFIAGIREDLERLRGKQ